jgi:hypothetical protein
MMIYRGMEVVASVAELIVQKDAYRVYNDRTDRGREGPRAVSEMRIIKACINHASRYQSWDVDRSQKRS